jgi:hypothetical protein
MLGWSPSAPSFEETVAMQPSRREFLRLAAVAAAGALPAGAVLALDGDAGEAFLAAVRGGDLQAVRRLLAAAPALLGATDGSGRSAFALAHLRGHAEIAAHLLARGYAADAHEAALAQDWERFGALAAADPASVHRHHPIGGTAMHAAAVGGAGADMWRIYAVSGDPNAVPRGAEGVSPLQAALRFRHLPVAEITAATLLANAADPNPANRAEDPPLHLAARRGSTEMVAMLVRHGAAVDALDGHGRRALESAELAGQAATAALLARQAEIPRTHSTARVAYDGAGRPYAAPDISGLPLAERLRFVGGSHGDLPYVAAALASDRRLAHSVATTGEICVEACAHTGQHPIVDLLLEHGAPYSLPTAVMRDDRPRVEALLDEDPRRIHERGAHDFALLWYPIIGRCGPEMLELLLARGAEVEEQHLLGTTALHWACRQGQLEMAELLIAHGADVDRRGRKFDPTGETPLECARKNDHQEMARLLIQRGARA